MKSDNRRKVKKVFDLIKKEVEKVLGAFTYKGGSLYSFVHEQGKQNDTVSFEKQDNGHNYVVALTLTKEINMSDITYLQS